MRVLVFGDSITQGFWDTEGGWVNRLRRYYDELEVEQFQDRYPTIFNLGISGDTTQDVIERVEGETKVRLWPGSQILYVFAVGINDTIYRGNEFTSNPEAYREQLLKLLEIASKFSNKIIFVGLTPAVDERVQPPKFSDSGKCYSNERILQFEKELKKFCDENNLMHVPLFDALKEEQMKQELMPDGLHPNNAGHELIYQLVRPKLDKLINSI